jgi:anti-anti-sigma factor
MAGWLSTRISGGVPGRTGRMIVACHGRLTYGNSQTLKSEVKFRIPGHKRLVLDLKGVPQMDSSGLGTVMALYVSARARGCTL